MRKYNYLVGYKGDGNVMYGKYYTRVNSDGIVKRCDEDYAEPMTIHQAKRSLKRMPNKGAKIFKLVEVKD